MTIVTVNYKSGHTRNDALVMAAAEKCNATDEVGYYRVPGAYADAAPLIEAIADYDRREKEKYAPRPRRAQKQHTTRDDDGGCGGGGMGL